MTDLTGDLLNTLHRFPVAPDCVRARGVAAAMKLPPLLTARHFTSVTEGRLYESVEGDEESRCPLDGEAAHRYQVSAWLDYALEVLLGAHAEMQSNGRVRLHSFATIDHVVSVFYRALLDGDSDKE